MTFLSHLFLSFFTAGLFLVSSVASFTFQAGNANSCNDLTVTWNGGQGPFSLVIIPVGGVPMNRSIPDSAFSNGKGSFSTKLNLPPTASDGKVQGAGQFVLTMGDATGPTSGGITQLMSVGQPQNGASCDTSPEKIAFFFELNSALQQCRFYNFDIENANSTFPITIFAIVPDGKVETLSTTSTPYQWQADIAAGTNVIFMMVNSQYQQGGSSQLLTSANTDDSTCLNANSPTATAVPTSAASNSKTMSTGAIVGATVGALVAVGSVGALVTFLLRRRLQRRRRTQYAYHNEIDEMDDHSRQKPLSQQPGQHPYSFVAGATTSDVSLHALPPPDPFLLQTPSSMTFPSSSSGSFGLRDSSGAYPPTPTQASMRKATEAATAASSSSGPPRRYVMHTDIEDTGADVEELPPQYKEWTQRVALEPRSAGDDVRGSTTLDMATHDPQSPRTPRPT